MENFIYYLQGEGLDLFSDETWKWESKGILCGVRNIEAIGLG